MGHGNVTAALSRWGPRVGANARCVLAYMASAAKDSDPDPRYYGGWMPLSQALGRDPFEYGPADKQAVRRALAELQQVGAVTTLSGGHRGTVATYRLNEINQSVRRLGVVS